MPHYKRPGGYIKNISSFVPSVAEVETAIPAFIGYTEKAGNQNEYLNEPVKITSLPDYEGIFGKADLEDQFEVNIMDKYDSMGRLSRKLSLSKPNNTSPFRMHYAMQLYFANGGGDCYVISVGNYGSGVVAPDDLGSTAGLKHLEKKDEPTLILFPDATSISQHEAYYTLMEEALTHCKKRKDRFTIIDVFNHDPDYADQLRNTILLNKDHLKYGAAYYPWLKTKIAYQYDNSKVLLRHKQSNAPPGTVNYNGLYLNDSSLKKDAALYGLIQHELAKWTVDMPPSAAVAGVYAKVDAHRGVWKAPANVALNLVKEPVKQIDQNEQENLNVHTSGKSINAIRHFNLRGTMIWGARTLAGNDKEWRYVPTIRFFMMVEESIKKALSSVVFEPNDANTWTRVRHLLENFLTLQWRNGALAGTKTDEAFFVKVGLGLTMTTNDLREGRMIVEIGMATMRPAEFVILKVMQQLHIP